MVIETNSTVGRKDGVDVTRLTLLYRKPGYEIGDVVQWRHHMWRPSAWTKEGAIMERIDRRERTGASWRDLEQAKVVAQRHEFTEVDFITEDASAGEFLDPNTWAMSLVRLPFDHIPGRKGLLIRQDEEWIALPHMAIDTPEQVED
jgi:nonsense-mediated mRNA decay protein 3